jgi:hypothetical protein
VSHYVFSVNTRTDYTLDRFNFTMDPSNLDPAKDATCTTCRFAEDKSNYWTAVMFFRHPNGSYIRVSISLFLLWYECRFSDLSNARSLKWRITTPVPGFKLEA